MNMKFASLTFITLIILYSCNSPLELHRTYKDISLPMTESDVKKLIGDREKLRVINLPHYQNLIAFPDSYEDQSFFSFITFKLKNHIVTGYTLVFAPKNDVDNFDSKQEIDAALKPLDQLIWFANPNNNSILNYRFENYLLQSITEKYGKDFISSEKDSLVITTDKFITPINIKEKKWTKNGLEVKLSRVTSTMAGFIKLKLQYNLAEAYIHKYKNQIELMSKGEIKMNSKF